MSNIANETLTRKCFRCSQEKSLNTNNFYPVNSESGGFEYECIPCHLSRMRTLRKSRIKYKPSDYVGTKFPESNLTINKIFVCDNKEKKYEVVCDCGQIKNLSRDAFYSQKSCGEANCPHAGRNAANSKQKVESLIINDVESGFQLSKGVYDVYRTNAEKRKIPWNLDQNGQKEGTDFQNVFKQYGGREKDWTNLPINGSIPNSKNDLEYSFDRKDSDKTLGYSPENIGIVLKFTNILKNRFSSFAVRLHMYMTVANMPQEEKEMFEIFRQDENACKEVFSKELKHKYKNKKRDRSRSKRIKGIQS